MRIIQIQTEVKEDRVLQVQLPKDMPLGPVEVLVVVETLPFRPTANERHLAAAAGCGALRDTGISSDEFLAERRVEEQRRDEHLQS